MVALAFLVAGLALFDAVLSLVNRYYSARIGEGLIYDLRSQVYAHVQQMPIAFFTRTQTGALITRLNNDVLGAQQAFTGTLSNVVSNAIGVVLTLVAMFVLSWQITLLSLVLLPLFVVPARLVGAKLQELTRESYALNAAMNTTMTERFNVSGALLVKLFGRPEREEQAFRDKAGRVRDIGITSAMYGRVFFVSLTTVAALATALVYGVGGTFAAQRHPAGRHGRRAVGVPHPAVRAAHGAVQRAGRRHDGAGELRAGLRGARPRADGRRPAGRRRRCRPARRRSSSTASSSATRPRARCRSPRWSRSRCSTRASRRRCCTACRSGPSPGELVALVGPSGAGKTTISQLVTRMYDVRGGAVRIGGLDVRDVTLQSLRDTVGVVTQDAHMFHDTIRANLLYAKPGATDDELWGALEAAQVGPLVHALPDGLDTVVGDRGYRLSGGEKQRMAIARLLLKAPGVVVLDEATAHLDSESEAAVQEALRTALAGRTSIVIAHRLSTVREADQILVLEDGRVAEHGRHEELLAAGGLYAELYRTQFARQADEPDPVAVD